jgi:hypothetical protein
MSSRSIGGCRRHVGVRTGLKALTIVPQVVVSVSGIGMGTRPLAGSVPGVTGGGLVPLDGRMSWPRPGTDRFEATGPYVPLGTLRGTQQSRQGGTRYAT